jgi:hypothetical protein
MMRKTWKMKMMMRRWRGNPWKMVRMKRSSLKRYLKMTYQSSHRSAQRQKLHQMMMKMKMRREVWMQP